MVRDYWPSHWLGIYCHRFYGAGARPSAIPQRWRAAIYPSGRALVQCVSRRAEPNAGHCSTLSVPKPLGPGDPHAFTMASLA